MAYSFESYLRDKHADNFVRPKDKIEQSFDQYIEDMDKEQLIFLADEYFVTNTKDLLSEIQNDLSKSSSDGKIEDGEADYIVNSYIKQLK